MEVWLDAIRTLIQPVNIMWFLGACVLGYLTGALPGMGGALTISLLIPITYYLDPSLALIIMGTVFVICVYGGSLAAILLNIPGTAGSAATCLDGYPMAQNGEARTALGISMMASLLGAVLSTIFLIIIASILLGPLLSLGPAEYFWIAVLGLTIIANVSSGGLVKGLIGGVIGLLLSFIGQDLITGEFRYTFGTLELISGLELVAVIIGFFGISEILDMMSGQKKTISTSGKLTGNVIGGCMLPFKYWFTTLRSGIIGFVVGIMPGVGYSVSTWLSYNEARRTSRSPETFGKGSTEGVVASETANNATVGGALVPTLLLGIPGSETAAVLMSGMIAHGIIPGPQLFELRGDLVYSFYVGLLLAGLFIGVMGLLFLPFAAKITVTPLRIIAPIVTVLALAGAISLNSNIMDVIVIISVGIFAYCMKYLGYPLVTVILGFVLGPILEQNMNRAFMIVGGNVSGLFVNPLSWVFIVLIIASVLQYILRQRREAA